MIRFPKLIKAAEEKLVCVREDLKARDAALLTSAEFAITVGNVTFTERTDGGASMLEAVSKCKTGETSPIGSFKGSELLVEKKLYGCQLSGASWQGQSIRQSFPQVLLEIW